MLKLFYSFQKRDLHLKERKSFLWKQTVSFKCRDFRCKFFPLSVYAFLGKRLAHMQVDRMSHKLPPLSKMAYNLPVTLRQITIIAHYENTPIQIYYKFYNEKMKIFR